MHCPDCGAAVDADSRFCKQCGAPVHDAEETRIARPATFGMERYDQDDDVEHVIFTVRPTLFFVKVGYGLAVALAIILTVLLAMVSSSYLPWWLSLPIGLGLLLIPAYYHLKRNMVRYTMTDAKLEIDYGLISRTTRNIPLSKIQDVTVSASLWQRIIGFGDLVIDNASEVGGTTVLRNISDPRHHAELLLRELRRWR